MIDTVSFAGLKIASITFDCPPALQRQRLRDGTVIDSSAGADLWRATVTINRDQHRKIAAAEAVIRRNTRVGRFMLAYDTRFNGPASDPSGSILGASVPKIDAISEPDSLIRLRDLPSNYALSVGDHIGWIYAGRYALHRIVTPAVAAGNGITNLFEIDPHIRPGSTTGTNVNLVRPVAKFRVEEFDPGLGAPRFTRGGTFSMIQTLG